MVFRAADGSLYMTLHTPNEHLKEHPVFIPLTDVGGRLVPWGQEPAWYVPMADALHGMAEELRSTLKPLTFPALTVTPEECGGVQQAIDETAARGGGTVLLTGEYVTGTVELRSNVRLQLQKGARLLGSTDLKDYPEHHARRLTVQDTSMGMHQSLIFAEGVSHIAITGEGEICGRGTPDNFPGDETAQGTPGRPFVIRMIDCYDIEISGITLRNSPCWMQNYLNCCRLLVDGITVRNHSNYNNDGIDIDGCRDVLVRGCNIHSGDDALCFKGAGMALTDRVLVEECELFSACNAVKVGTDTQGSFRNILVRNCRIGGLAEDPSGLKHPCCDSAISLEMMDGGVLEQVLVEDCVMERAWSPVFLRLEDRGRVRPGDPKPAPGSLRRCAVVNVTGTDCGPRGSYMLGVPEKAIEDILLKDISVAQQPSTKPVIDESAIDECRGLYPDAHMIDSVGDSPALGLWCRHVNGLTLMNCRFTAENDPRPQLVLKTDVWANAL